MLTKGLSRPAVILSKFTVSALIMTAGHWICFGITYAYTAHFWPGAELPYTLFAAFCLWVLGLMCLSILILGVVMLRQGFLGVVFVAVILGIFEIAGMLLPLQRFDPFNFTMWNMGLLSGTAAASDFILPLIAALFFSIAFLTGAVFLFKKKRV